MQVLPTREKTDELHIALRTRVTILNSLVRSRLTYACQTWTLSTSQRDRSNSFYCGLLRRMIRGGFKRKTDSMAYILSNEDVLRICNTEMLETFVARQQKAFLAHIIRRDDNSLVKQLTFNNDDNKRRGRFTTLCKTVLQREAQSNERMSPNEFYRSAISRKI